MLFTNLNHGFMIVL